MATNWPFIWALVGILAITLTATVVIARLQGEADAAQKKAARFSATQDFLWAERDEARKELKKAEAERDKWKWAYRDLRNGVETLQRQHDAFVKPLPSAIEPEDDGR